jgi:hypothetical protein
MGGDARATRTDGPDRQVTDHTQPPTAAEEPSRGPLYALDATHLYALYQGRKTSFTTPKTPSSLNRRVSARTTGL